jgi:hypothetical protein
MKMFFCLSSLFSNLKMSMANSVFAEAIPVSPEFEVFDTAGCPCCLLQDHQVFSPSMHSACCKGGSKDKNAKQI